MSAGAESFVLQIEPGDWVRVLQDDVPLLVEFHQLVIGSSTIDEIRTWLDGHGIRHSVENFDVAEAAVLAEGPLERWS